MNPFPAIFGGLYGACQVSWHWIDRRAIELLHAVTFARCLREHSRLRQG